MTANKAARREGGSPIVWSVKATCASAILATMIGTICVARMALADPAPLTVDDYVGRWVSKNRPLTLDVTRCGEGLCGVVVADGACGYTALRAAEVPDDTQYRTATNREMSGRLQLAEKTLAYGVKVMLTRADDGAITLQIGGHTNVFSPLRRSYDYNAVFARAGDATCAPSPKTS